VNDAVKAVNIDVNDGRKALAQMDKAGAHLVNTVAILREDAFRLAK